MSILSTLVQGALVGIANIIPGVSGGTFALVLGIYEWLLAAIGAFGLATLRATAQLFAAPGSPERRGAFVREMKRIDLLWLALLAVGAAVAILASSRLIAWLLEAHRAPTLAFFVGLIIPSIAVPWRLLERRSWPEALACLAGLAGLVALTLLPAATVAGGPGWLGLFLGGALAISAMILPGVSGSFLLMILGQYKAVLDAINGFDLVRLGLFALGCVAGLLAFVRLLNLLLRRFHSVTIAFLIGLILGSLWVLWPFKQVAPDAKIITGSNIWPPALTAEVGWAVGALALGLVGSAGVMWLGRQRRGALEVADGP